MDAEGKAWEVEGLQSQDTHLEPQTPRVSPTSTYLGLCWLTPK